MNTIDKPTRVSRILEWAERNQITGFGRWGTWEHMNSDIAVKQAIKLGEETAAAAKIRLNSEQLTK